ncbi:MAG TPA: hypothetical protein VMZ29_15910 [Candidatus Bathyarchaeia archaeon]|nr:hypothetical protein [Candidatus Bathyarchaeia archaeon]
MKVKRKLNSKKLLFFIQILILILPLIFHQTNFSENTTITEISPITSKFNSFSFDELGDWSEEITIIVDVFVENTTCYAIAPNGLYIYDISNEEAPILLSSTSWGSNYCALHVQDSIVYLVSNYGTFEIFNASDPYNPEYVYSCSTEGEFNDVYVNGTLIYFSKMTQGIEVYNITSYWSIERLDVFRNYWTFYICYNNNYLFILDQGFIHFVNVTDPTNITETGSFHVGLAGFITVEGNYLYYVGREVIDKYDISNLFAPNLLHSYYHNYYSIPTCGTSKNGIISLGYELIGIRLINYSNSMAVHQIAAINDGGLIHDLFLTDTCLFTAEIWDGLEIYNLDDPTVENKIHLQANGMFDDIILQNRTIFLARGCNGLTILNITDTWTFEELSNYDDTGIYHRLLIQDNYLFILTQFFGVKIFDISDLTNPILIGEFPYPTIELYDFDIQENLLAIAAGTNGTILVDISDKYNPKLITIISLRYSYIAHVFIEDELLFVCDAGNIAYIYNCLDTTDVTFIRSISRKITGVESDGNYLYIGSSLLEIYDFSDPFNPILIKNKVTGFILQLYLRNQIVYCLTANGIIVYEIETDYDIILLSEYLYEPDYENTYDNYLIEFSFRIKWSNGITVLVDNILGTLLLTTDIDSDGLDDYIEYEETKTNPYNPDSDEDGLSDFEEWFQTFTDPNNADTDFDSLSDFDELKIYFTDPLNPDTDGDGFSDGDEVLKYHTDPLNANDYPKLLVRKTIISLAAIFSILIIAVLSYVVSIQLVKHRKKINSKRKEITQKSNNLSLFIALALIPHETEKTLNELSLQTSIKEYMIIDYLTEWEKSGILQFLGQYNKEKSIFHRKSAYDYPNNEVLCYYCGNKINTTDIMCTKCDFEVAICSTCNMPIEPSQLVVVCPKCNSLHHLDHLLNHIEKYGHCPKCLQTLNFDMLDIQIFEKGSNFYSDD